MQTSMEMAAWLFTHWKKHWPTLPPLAHWRKHWRSCWQAESPRQPMSWPQQLSETQLPQASPVGGQSGAGPHFPPLHWLEQHCAFWLQLCPLGRHAGGPHLPPLHWLEQQSVALPHIAPSGAHAFGPQRPLLHWALQQSPPPLQGAPSVEQPGGPQVPALHWPPQQSAALAQACPFGLQSTQVPFVQLELQQS
jgi:hypothetical protein